MSIIDPVRTRVDLATLNLGFGAFPSVQPFSPRTAVGYQDLLESLYRYVTRDIFNYLAAASGQATWDSNVDILLAAIDTVLAEQKSDIDTETAAALQAVIDSTIAISDPVTYAIINDPTTATAVKLTALFGLTDQKLHDALGTVTYGALDARYVKPAVSARNAITGWWHVDEFGAVGDGVTHDEVAAQAAIDAAAATYLSTGVPQRVFFGSRCYALGPQSLSTDSQVIYGLLVKSGVELYGDGTLLCAPGSYWIGTQYSLIRSAPAGVTTCGIQGLTIDGNRGAYSVPGDTTQCNNITFGPSIDVSFIDVTSKNAAGTGLMVAGHSNQWSNDVRIAGCRVYDTGNIGIQVAQFEGLNIENCIVRNTASNAIDIYGEHESHNGTINGKSFRISANTVHGASGVAIFLETVAQGTVVGNLIYNGNQEGIHINRINGQPSMINIVDNEIINCATGIGATGDADNITIRGNAIHKFNTAGVFFGGGGSPGDSGTIAGYNVIDNTMTGNAPSTPMIVFGSGLGHIINTFIKGNNTENSATPCVVNYGPGAINSTWQPAALYPGGPLS